MTFHLILRVLFWALAAPCITILGYIIANEIPRYLRRRAGMYPKCPSCGRGDQSRWLWARWFGSGGKWHDQQWRVEFNRREISCWHCGARWPLDAVSQVMEGLDPGRWSYPVAVPKKKEEQAK